MRRRTILSSTGAALSSIFSGCSAISRPSSEGRDTDESDTRSNTDSEDTDTVESDVGSSLQLGATQPVSIVAEPEREFEPDSDGPFDEWLTKRAGFAGASHVHSLLEDEGLMEAAIHVGPHTVELDDLGGQADELELERAIPIGVVVRQTPGFLQGGERVGKPKIEFAKLVEAAPRSIEVTMTVDDGEHTVVLPVVCRNERT